MQSVNIEINVCDSTGKSTCTIHPPIQVDPHSCCHSNNECEPQPSVSGVTSVFGRTGVVTAQLGDYTADQITETATRKFASLDEKAIWNAKQDALVSGTTIRTLFGQSLLGSGDVSPTPAQMGVAAADHTHTTADITDYTQKTKQLIHSSLEAGAGVTLSYNPVNEKTIISAAGGSGSGGSGYIVADRQGATAGENHAFSISPQNTFNLAAYALKEEAGAANQTYVVDDFNASSEPNYNTTSEVVFDDSMKLFTGRKYELLSDGGLFYTNANINGSSVDIYISSHGESVVPFMISDTTPVGYIARSSSTYDSSTQAYSAFSNKENQVWAARTVPIQWISIELPNVTEIVSYQIDNRPPGGYNNHPKSWTLQGSTDGNVWVEIHKVTNSNDNNGGSVRSYDLTNPVSYKFYRLYVTEAFTNGAVIVGKLKLIPAIDRRFILNAGKNYTIDKNGGLIEITDTITPELIQSVGVSEIRGINPASLGLPEAVKVISSENIEITTKVKPYSQIVISKSLLSASVGSWAKINAATLTATQTGNGKVRVAVTRDLINWHALRNGAWVDVGTLSADTAGAEALIADGMTPAELGAITAAQWTQLFTSNNGVPDSLAFAFALDITDPVTDVATIERLVLNVNDASSWKVQSPAEVEIRWRTDSVTFRTATAGNYKLAYQVP
ncbi:discoidin domain-containing protein [Pectobacterium quasiaquaticum]|uniref:discoidin domain-containing protein n=1 Tax=Pectobacterium quasiaquaticum TaxID=2774015 RepID=UPI0018750883|nr:discoidin domain-containing protein [Pectobacterium quasiaquaticum]URG51798.1 discoidin domain-containing protein [Pectobacterium quasiaquaticum]